ncbi:MAG: HEPN domain-containing protein [Saprospiraceae bacterium]|nr:HEPN domain-containing protein [Saprospiraceae bacterium]
MKSSERDAYIKYRIEKAGENYEVALLLIENEKWNSAINRLYYAAYYAIGGLLLKFEIETKTHTGVKTQFFLHFVKTGKIAMDLGKLYADLFDWR